MSALAAMASLRPGRGVVGQGRGKTEPGRPPFVRSFAPEENPFETVVADVTHRCNMACANCYLPNRGIPDMDIGRLEACLAALPGRVNLRLIGAEPTMRRDLPEIVAMVRRRGHRAVLLTNGLRLARESYVHTLRDAGLRHVYVSMNGADNDDWYEAIDNMRCAAKKLRAVENAVSHGMIVNTGTILVRGVNEGAVGRLRRFMADLGPRHAVLRFKNIGAFGRYDAASKARNLSMAEMEALCAAAIGADAAALAAWDRIKGKAEAGNRLFPVDLATRTGRGLWFKLTDWHAKVDECGESDFRRRGRITQDFRIAPFFDHVKANEGGY
ncbi:MAG: radical SAM protein [Alphaproteobacteria bacterium]|nr:radical SAM protein [Alphaproteobacteria bacterium]